MILSETIPRLLSPEEFNVPGMIAFAIAGIALNGVATLHLEHITLEIEYSDEDCSMHAVH